MKKTNEVIILSGMPCSGKSTWVNNYLLNPKNLYKSIFVLSRDSMRIALYGKKYRQNIKDEVLITVKFNETLYDLLKEDNVTIIIDNTNCKEGYIDSFIKKCKNTNITIMFFEVSFLTAMWRNITRYFNEGKWIPLNVMIRMKRQFNKIDKKKYAKNFSCSFIS